MLQVEDHQEQDEHHSKLCSILLQLTTIGVNNHNFGWLGCLLPYQLCEGLYGWMMEAHHLWARARCLLFELAPHFIQAKNVIGKLRAALHLGPLHTQG
jgi:hypothetical protein